MCCTFVTYNPKFLLVEAINVEFPFHISELLFLYRKAVGFLNRVLCIPNCCSLIVCSCFPVTLLGFPGLLAP